MNDNGMGYFEKAYIEEHHWPTNCAKCNIRFVASKEATKGGGEYIVNATTPCWLCHNADNGNHKCTYALCNTCKFEQVEKEEEALRTKMSGGAVRSSRRARKARKLFD